MEDRPVVLVTGARKGIGRHLAEHFASQGFLVEGCSREAPDWELRDYVHHCVDITDESQVKQMTSSIQRRHGRLDVAINNAGIASMNLALLTPAATAERIIATNLLGTMLVARESARLMARRKYGRIVNFTTIAVPMALKGESVYAASKSAVETYTRVLARELAPLGITCNTVGPGPVETDLLRGVPDDKIADIISGLAIQRMCRLEDVANVVDFFVSPNSDYVTGQVIYLGGVG